MEEDDKFIKEWIEDLKYQHINLGLSDKYYKTLERFIKRYKELEEENAMLKKAIEEDVSKDSSSIKINAIKYQGYLEGYAERDRLAKEEYEECCKIEKNRRYIPISVIQNTLEDLKIDRNAIKKEIEEAKKEKNKEYYADLLSHLRVNYGAIQVLNEILEKGNK